MLTKDDRDTVLTSPGSEKLPRPAGSAEQKASGKLGSLFRGWPASSEELDLTF